MLLVHVENIAIYFTCNIYGCPLVYNKVDSRVESELVEPNHDSVATSQEPDSASHVIVTTISRDTG
jgi:hypothetical protein